MDQMNHNFAELCVLYQAHQLQGAFQDLFPGAILISLL